MSALAALREFFSRFRLDLYRLGYSDAIEGSGACSAMTFEEMRRALAYLKGYADACRIANDYMSPPWHAAHLLGCAAGILLCHIDADWSEQAISALCNQYTREFRDMAERLP